MTIKNFHSTLAVCHPVSDDTTSDRLRTRQCSTRSENTSPQFLCKIHRATPSRFGGSEQPFCLVQPNALQKDTGPNQRLHPTLASRLDPTGTQLVAETMSAPPFPNEYTLRTVAEVSSKPCFVCHKPTTKVLTTVGNKVGSIVSICRAVSQDTSFHVCHSTWQSHARERSLHVRPAYNELELVLMVTENTSLSFEQYCSIRGDSRIDVQSFDLIVIVGFDYPWGHCRASDYLRDETYPI